MHDRFFLVIPYALTHKKKIRAVGQTNFINGPKQLNLPNARGALLEAMVFSIVAGDS